MAAAPRSSLRPGVEAIDPTAYSQLIGASLLPTDLPPGRAGDPGLIGPGTAVWRVGREKALLLGGPAALLLQVAHPAVARGVVEHSDFEGDPLARLRRTLDVMLTVAFGDQAQAEAAAAGVAALHDRVVGRGYRARDPELALWVHATIVLTALEVYDRFVAPLSGAERAAYYEEYKPVGRLFGVTAEVMPRSHADFEDYVERVESTVLEVGDDARSIARGIFEAKVVGPRWLTRRAMEAAAASLLPPRVRDGYGLGWGAGRRSFYRAVRVAARPGVRVAPARARYWQHYRQACRRLAAGV